MNDILTLLKEHLPALTMVTGEAIEPRYLSDFSGLQGARPLALLKPASSEEVAGIMRLCHQHRQVVVPQGGMTGIVGGALALEDCIILSLEKMRAIEELDQKSATLTAQAGAPLSTIQEAAEAAGFLFPLDIGARDSCLIGGNVSTNAGGNRVVKYGMTRQLVLGLEVVLADGTIISALNKMIKNNSGYDLKQLFIGSEGTLGIVTRVVLRLSPKPLSKATALCAMADFDSAIALLHAANEGLPGGVSSFELMWSSFYKTMTESVDYIDAPLSTEYPLYVILECMGQNPLQDMRQFEHFLEQKFADETIVDAVIAKSEADAESIWAVRDSVIEFARLFPEYVGFDVSVPISTMEAFVEGVNVALNSKWPALIKLFFGHIGDSNLHLIVDISGGDAGLKQAINDIVYAEVRARGGAVSAEHGIGLSKLDYLDYSASAAEIALMRTIKQALDPHAILNPGKVLHG